MCNFFCGFAAEIDLSNFIHTQASNPTETHRVNVFAKDRRKHLQGRAFWFIFLLSFQKRIWKIDLTKTFCKGEKRWKHAKKAIF
jgi:hypothetical protein